MLLILFPLAVEGIGRRTNLPSHDTDSNQYYHHQDNSDPPQDQNRDSPSADLSYDLPEVATVTTATNTYLAPSELEIIRINDTSVVLRWYLAAHDQLQFFKIQYKSTKRDAVWRTESREIPPNYRAYQINGLRPGNYFFIVSAVYDNDDNVPSEQFKFRLRGRSKISTDDLPEQKAPEIFWSSASYDYIRCKWKYSFKEKDLENYGYLVYYRSAHTVAEFIIYNTLDENVEIAELDPETPYEVKVVAYNAHGVSEFSETKTIKTEAKPNTTTTHVTQSLVSSTTTMKPTTLLHNPPMDRSTAKPNSQSATVNFTMTTAASNPPTQRPPTDGTTTTSGSNSNSSSINNWFSYLLTEADTIISGRDHKSLAIRYTILVLLPILLITFVSVCLIACYNRHKDSPPSSTHASIQFDLEISGYFKNSFPGVEKEYSSMANHHAHHGFVNHHPHINDFA